MVSLAARRRVVDHLLEQGFSRVVACRNAGLSRASSRRKPKERNPELVAKVVSLAYKFPRYGFRRVHALLEGVNIKAVHRIWKAHGLKLKRKARRRLKVEPINTPAFTKPNQAWCTDFVHETLANGRSVRILAVLDCFTRECLCLRARPSFPAFSVKEELDFLFLVHGKPERIVSDNGPEFRALDLPEGVEAAFIAPGKPWMNGYIESFNAKLRDEVLNRHWSASRK